MPDTFKFPKGFDVKVYRKKDIIACINENIIDKEIALELIEKCELDAVNFLQQGKWSSIPYLGNFRVPKHITKIKSKEVQELLNEAETTLNKEKYVLFRKQLYGDIKSDIKKERYYNYIVSGLIRKNPKLFKYFCNKFGDAYARFKLYCMKDMDSVSTNYYGEI